MQLPDASRGCILMTAWTCADASSIALPLPPPTPLSAAQHGLCDDWHHIHVSQQHVHRNITMLQYITDSLMCQTCETRGHMKPGEIGNSQLCTY